ncbi:hypothetical protein [Sphingobacterium lumbrici]|uniref:hypothetical protein n=1 Tax=Sphingobacterium lumbrici TaxID=2559600 RepID=UPI00112C4D22|nr:hypothetical protein [Sphingobacterium lumbrici]
MKKFFLLLLTFASFTAFGQTGYKPGFQSKVTFGSAFTVLNEEIEMMQLKFDYVGQVTLSPYVSIGAGTGIRHYLDFDYSSSKDNWFDIDFNQELMIPLYGHLNVRFLDKKASPFISTSLGYAFGVNLNSDVKDFYKINFKSDDPKFKSGFIADVSTGVSIRVKNRLGLVAGPYLEYQHTERQIFELGAGDVAVERREELHLFNWGLKVGFTF